ncbi:MAG TPA: beta-galactosidase [Porphyromonadaceae bacterium]|jgi:beta-galactosidase|nr:beta-galactosidase [Porphyromonadaceae bacterium]HCM20338.1 beta-galactosidase [Porphyromonadaceae bacterium]
MKKAFLLLFFIIVSLSLSAKHKQTFMIKDGQFIHNGKPTRIISGEMHYLRIPHQYWKHRLQMLKAMGANTVATYVFWNAHEAEPGKWDFSGDKNLAEFIRIAGEEGLHVILRPGPYACAEWEFGGYPWWLQNVDGLELRRDNPPFLKYTQLYINRLFQEVGHLQVTEGGPVIMVQVENEFGSYVSQRKDISLEDHRRYNAKIKDQLLAAGFDVPLFTSDGTWLFEGGSLEGVLTTANGEGNIENLKKTVNRYHDGKGPYMVAEFYSGWLAHWNEPHPEVDASDVARKTEEYLQNDVSFNYYMVHGGTNFGFTSGANYDKERDIQPDLTSYDYDAPISEAGWRTPKFDSIRNVIEKYVSYTLPDIPDALPIIEIPEIQLTRVADVLSWAEKMTPVKNERPLTFEELNQGYGYVLYTRHFNQPIGGQLEISGLRDYAVVYVDGEKVGELNRNTKQYALPVDIPFNATLQILVENMGRINYGAEIVHNKKGIISPVKINDIEITGDWKMYSLPMQECPKLTSSENLPNHPDINSELAGKPLLYEGAFLLNEVGDTFIDMQNWGKGIVFVNGRNIGRYWKVGPQQTLFIPGVWLKKGENQLLIFEQLNDEMQQQVHTVKQPILRKLLDPRQ